MLNARRITGVVLAGGEGRRLGGVDKGLQLYAGKPLVEQALARLAPQVGRLMISANRHLDTYRALGRPVWPDDIEAPDSQGPLAGIATALGHCETPYLVTVPCDVPHFPMDLLTRLIRALQDSDTDLAIAATAGSGTTAPSLHPTFCLMKASLRGDLLASLSAGERSIRRWAQRHRLAVATFDDPNAFFNINTPEDLARVATPPG